MTAPPGTRFVDGLRVTPAHLNHLQAVADAAVADLRRVVGRDRVAIGFRLLVEGTSAVLTPGVGFTRSGLPVRRDEAVALSLPAGTDPVAVGVRAVAHEDDATRVGDVATIVDLLSEVVVPADAADPDTLVVGTVTPGSGGDAPSVDQNTSAFVPPHSHRHSGTFVQDEDGVWLFDGATVTGGGGGQGPKGDPGEKGDKGDPGDKGQKGDTGETGRPGEGLPQDVTLLKGVNWSIVDPVGVGALRDLAAKLQLEWSAELDAGSAPRFARAMAQVFIAPIDGGFPVTRPAFRLDVDANVVTFTVELDDQSLTALGKVGGALLLDLVCDYLVDTNGNPVSSSQALLRDARAPALPGGLMRLTVPVERG